MEGSGGGLTLLDPHRAGVPPWGAAHCPQAAVMRLPALPCMSRDDLVSSTCLLLRLSPQPISALTSLPLPVPHSLGGSRPPCHPSPRFLGRVGLLGTNTSAQAGGGGGALCPSPSAGEAQPSCVRVLPTVHRKPKPHCSTGEGHAQEGHKGQKNKKLSRKKNHKRDGQ